MRWQTEGRPVTYYCVLVIMQHTVVIHSIVDDDQGRTGAKKRTGKYAYA